MKILIDDREDNERVQLIKSDDFFKDAIVERLDTGDIIFLQEGDAPDIAIEVKTRQDFVGSCRNRRMQEEALKMKKQYPFSFIVLYDDGKFRGDYTRFTWTELYGNMVSLTVRYKVPVFQAATKRHFIIMLKSIIRNVNKFD